MPRFHGYTDEESYLYTGLAYNEDYAGIISAVNGQIYDGIGEGSGRESAIFRHYYEGLVETNSASKNGEFVIYNNAYKFSQYEVEQLVRCIWRIAQIEREDNGKPDNKNITYTYLDDAPWAAICKLNGKLNAIAKEMSNGTFKNEPWAEQKAQENRDRIEAKKKAEQEEKERQESQEKAKQDQREFEIQKFIDTHKPDDKDNERAYNAWQKTKDFKKAYGYHDEFSKQEKLIKDDNKLVRRTIAFYNYLENIYNNTDEIPDDKRNYAKQMLNWLNRDIERHMNEEKKMNESIEGFSNDELYAMGYDAFAFGEDPSDYEEYENTLWAEGWADAEKDYEEQQELIRQHEEDEKNKFLADDYNELYENILKENKQ